MITVAIVFPVFNGLAYTKKGLKALYERFEEIKDPSFSFKVIIVDDGSKDGTGDWIREHYPQVKLLEGSGNLWWSGGINKALQAGLDDPEIDYFIWWNNDIIPDENYFRNVCELLKGHDTGTVYGSKIYLDDQYDTIWSMGGLFDPVTGRKSMIGTATKDGPAFEKPQECDWLTGMGTITHRSVYEKIGLLDEGRFPQYHGDSDLPSEQKKLDLR